MKHLLFAAYIFSVLYCYLQLNTMMDRAIEIFKERHPAIPIGNAPFGKGLSLSLETLAISAIPVANVFLGYFISTMGEGLISEIVDTVEMNHWNDIKEVESSLEEKLGSDRQDSATGNH